MKNQNSKKVASKQSKLSIMRVQNFNKKMKCKKKEGGGKI